MLAAPGETGPVYHWRYVRAGWVFGLRDLRSKGTSLELFWRLEAGAEAISETCLVKIAVGKNSFWELNTIRLLGMRCMELLMGGWW